METKEQLVEKLKAATNILVTVSSNPSVDQLSSCIGMTLWLNKAGKHATAVFSGDIPDTLEFLQPETTIEKNTDSLRDFIIALDKSKADKLTYKIEDRVVKISITPYRTSLGADDLEYSQGDFNVDAVVAIGVTKQKDIDQAITSHGRILHDAVVTTINVGDDVSDIGSVNWLEKGASSLCELVFEVCKTLDANQLDPQIATALLTGVVAATGRFANGKTTPNTMSIAAALMAAGANQQLVANKLSETTTEPVKPKSDMSNQAEEVSDAELQSDQNTNSNGILEIDHDTDELKPNEEAIPTVEAQEHSDDNENEDDLLNNSRNNSSRVFESEDSVGPLNSDSRFSEQFSGPVMDSYSTSSGDEPKLLHHTQEGNGNNAIAQEETNEENPPYIPTTQPPAGITNVIDPPQPPAPLGVTPAINNVESQTLEDLEKAIHSPHIDQLHEQVDSALDSGTTEPESSTSFDPSKFSIDNNDNDAAPEVPPPIISPNYLPPEPPIH